MDKKDISNFEDLKNMYSVEIKPYAIRIEDFKTTKRFVLQPDFQRTYVWSAQKASLLIESILLSLPIPPVYSYTELGSGKELIIDGQQRLTSIKNFLNNSFKLQGLTILSCLNGLEFYQLQDNFRQRLLTYDISVFCLNNISNPKIIFNIFERFNTGGLRLNAQEIRNCIYNGKYNNFIKKQIVTYKNFEKLLEKFKPKRFLLQELAVRFFALYDGMDSYKGNMNKFLNDYYEEKQYLNTFSKDDFSNYVKRYEKTFRDCVDACEIVFGHNAFKNIDKYEYVNDGKTYGFGVFSKYAFDMQMLGFADKDLADINRHAEKIRKKYIDIVLTYADMEPTARNNNKLTAERIRKWQDCIGKIIYE